MRETLPSLTAMIVSALRGVPRHGDDVLDPHAAALLPSPAGSILRGVREGSRASSIVEGLVRHASLGLLDHLTLRTLAIDEAVKAALRAGAAQVVLLGAGLDARAYRLGELERVPVFEVDHPATQAYKRAHAARLPERPLLRYVAVDFGRDSLRARLADAGHDADTPSLWVWEGVTMYLSEGAVRATLADVASRSAAGSWLLATYVTPAKVTAGWLVGPISAPAFKLLGEPLGATFTPAAFAALLAELGFEVDRDRGVLEWARDLGRRRGGLLTLAERLAIARRRL